MFFRKPILSFTAALLMGTTICAQTEEPPALPVETKDISGTAKTICTVTKMPDKPFTSTAGTKKFQNTLSLVTIEGTDCILQECAALSFEEARSAAAAAGIKITQRGTGSVACLRSYYMTAYLWNRHLVNSLDYQVRKKRLTKDEADTIKNHKGLYPTEKILKMEKERGILLGAYGTKSIIYSAGIPGTSEHIAGLALDIEQYKDPIVISIMNQHGWYQKSPWDPHHFSYFGQLGDDELKSLGFRKNISGKTVYWRHSAF